MAGLNPKQQKFVTEYIRTGNAIQSYIAAGYKGRGRSAESAATQLRHNVKVHAAINAAETTALVRAEIRNELTAEWVLAELRKIAAFDPRRLYNPDGTVKSIPELDDDTAACIASFEVEETPGPDGVVKTRVKKVKVWDKRLALADLGKRFNLWGDERPDASESVFATLVRQALQNAIRDRPSGPAPDRGLVVVAGPIGGGGIPPVVADTPPPPSD